ncbi:hypothetical protein FZI91_22265 [Mycobacterium sp. CBMA271]|nr:hypothetical protein [Mycobacteroides sp. CBMA 271]
MFGARDQSVHDLVPGDTFTTSTGIVGVVTPIEWTIVEKTTRSDLIATRRGRYHVVSRGLLGATATVVLNIYERESSVIAELFVLVDELILAGDLQHSFETAIDHQIDSLIASARKRFRVLRDMTELPTT